MALLPALRPLQVGPADAPHLLEVYVDYLCPFSAKITLNALDAIIKPLLSDGGQYKGKIKLILRLQPQPWHSSSTLLHEAALAVVKVAPDKFWDYSLELFRQQQEYFDIPASTQTPVQIRAKLVNIAKPLLTEQQLAEVEELLKHKTTPNGGVGVTDDLKYNIKLGRQNGIHVTPTVLWDGLVASEVSSSWTEEQWLPFISQRVQ
jgi:protein-disulfide isomerase